MTQHFNKIVRSLPFDDYITAPGYIHQSDLKAIMQSINHWELKKIVDPTDAQNVGTMGHTFIHEFGDINDRYMVVPSGDGRLKAVKDLRKQAKEQAESEGKKLITQDEFQMGFQWRESAMANPLLKTMFESDPNDHEVSAFWKLDNGLKACLRMDYFGEEIGIIIDSKFMLKGSPKDFYRDVWKYGYHMQNAWYVDGMKKITGEDFNFLFLVIEKSFPWNITLYELDEEWINKGREDINKAIDKLIKYQDCSDANEKKKLRGYYDGICTLKMKGNNGSL